MNNKKNNLKSLISDTIKESFEPKEDKIIDKDDLPKTNDKKVEIDKPSEENELIRLTVAGFTQAFDAIKRAKDLNPSAYKDFAVGVLKSLHGAGVELGMLKELVKSRIKT